MSCILALLAAILSWWQISSVSHAYSISLERGQKFKVIKSLLEAEHLLGDERGYTNEYLLSSVNNESNAKVALDINRRKTDLSLEQLSDVPQITTQIIQFKRVLDETRKTIDNVMSNPKRAPAEINTALDSSLDTTKIFNEIMVNTSISYASSDVSVSGYFYNLMALGEIRDTLGRLATPYIYALRFNKPLSAEELYASNKRKIRLDMLWSLLDGFKYDKTMFSELNTAKNTYKIKTSFLINSIENNSKNGMPTDTNLDLFLIQYREGLSGFYFMESEYIKHLDNVFHAQTTKALSRLIAVIVSLLGVLFIIAFICVFINVKVLNPLLSLNKTIRKVIGNRADDQVIDAEGMSEIQRLFESVDVLDSVFKEHKAESRELTQKLGEDPLTGVLNRRGFDEKVLTMSLHENAPGMRVLAIIDIDFFKTINDTWGHPFGDDVLVGLAQVLQASCRKDDIVARLGGEEFAMILHADSHEQAEKILTRCQDNIREMKFPTEGDDFVSITVSFGVVKMDTAPIDQLMKKADQALYLSKRRGRDKISWGNEL